MWPWLVSNWWPPRTFRFLRHIHLDVSHVVIVITEINQIYLEMTCTFVTDYWTWNINWKIFPDDGEWFFHLTNIKIHTNFTTEGFEHSPKIVLYSTLFMVNSSECRLSAEVIEHDSHTHTTIFTKAWQIQNIDISVRREKIYIYKQKINRCKVILTTAN